MPWTQQIQKNAWACGKKKQMSTRHSKKKKKKKEKKTKKKTKKKRALATQKKPKRVKLQLIYSKNSWFTFPSIDESPTAGNPITTHSNV